jgi:hypothetical protein
MNQLINATPTITQSELKDLLDYDPDTGIFVWKIKFSKRITIGDVAGSKDKNGYTNIRINGRTYKAHRLVWLYITGKFPKYHIDHIYGDSSDNRFTKLRDKPQKINNENRRKPAKNNTTGFLGVSFNNKMGKYTATIRTNYKHNFLGCFNTPEEAHEVYLKAKRELHVGCTI